MCSRFTPKSSCPAFYHNEDSRLVSQFDIDCDHPSLLGEQDKCVLLNLNAASLEIIEKILEGGENGIQALLPGALFLCRW